MIPIHKRGPQYIRPLLQFAAILAVVAAVFWTISKISDWYMTRADPNGSVAGQAQITVRARAANEAPTSGQPPRLQAIFYSGNGHSKAILNKKSVTVGDTVGGYKVSLIEPHSVMLRSPEGKAVVLIPEGGER